MRYVALRHHHTSTTHRQFIDNSSTTHRQLIDFTWAEEHSSSSRSAVIISHRDLKAHMRLPPSVGCGENDNATADEAWRPVGIEQHHPMARSPDSSANQTSSVQSFPLNRCYCQDQSIRPDLHSMVVGKPRGRYASSRLSWHVHVHWIVEHRVFLRHVGRCPFACQRTRSAAGRESSTSM